MKIIDKTPLLNEKGELGFIQRFQGMMEYGYNWPNELQAQKAIITYFDRQLEKGYTLIHNYTLGKSGITVPIILLGPSGIHVIHVAYLKGRYEARGEAWNVATGDGFKPAPDNLVQKTQRMARAVRAFIERQGVKVPVEVEPVLIGGDPGLHIEAVEPAIRVLMIDGVKSFVSKLATAQPVLRAESVYEFSERLLNPHMPRKAPAGVPRAAEPAALLAQQDPVVMRAQAIFKASEEVRPFDPTDFDFAMDDEPSFEVIPPAAAPASPSPLPVVEPAPPSKPARKRTLGMTPLQLAIVIGLALVLLCIIAGFATYFFAVT
ncbi:MAG: nuclease-related domain-containing protein [Bacteroidota bacterium]|jgi:hypothetical protein